LPAETHGDKDSGLKPFLTINKAIRNIPSNATHHEKNGRFFNEAKPAYDGNIIAKTITCGGGQGNYHPSGLRSLTTRERASLQTVPRYHSFANNCHTEASKQVGNMVPPAFAKALYKAIIQSLKEADRQEAEGMFD